MNWLKSNGCSLAVGVTSKRYGNDRVLALEPVTSSDLLSARDQTWWDGLRAGVLPSDLFELEIEVHPGENEGPDRLSGFYMQMCGGRQTYRRHFKPSTLSQTLARPLERLLSQETLKADDEYDYFLTARPQDEAHHKGETKGMHASKRHCEPLQFETAPLREFMENSEDLSGPTSKQLAAQETESKQMSVFIDEDVWQEGRELARLGGDDESAAVATGQLYRDSESPEVFVVLSAVLQAEFATEEKYNVEFTGDTWGQVRSRLEQRRRRLNRPNEIIVGSVHGHNF